MMKRWWLIPWVLLAGWSAFSGLNALHQFQKNLDELRAAAAPVTEWMIVHDLAVPDFRVGENPDVAFYRTVSRSLFGGWGVEVHDREGRQLCSETSGKGGGSVYQPSEGARVLIPFRAYTGGCVLPAGEFRLSVTIRLSDQSKTPSKMISFQSNWFTVRPI